MLPSHFPVLSKTRQQSTASFQRTARSLALVKEIPFSKVKLKFLAAQALIIVHSFYIGELVRV